MSVRRLPRLALVAAPLAVLAAWATLVRTPDARAQAQSFTALMAFLARSLGPTSR